MMHFGASFMCHLVTVIGTRHFFAFSVLIAAVDTKVDLFLCEEAIS